MASSARDSRRLHGRGSDELIHRALKDFGFEQFPFKRFARNAAFYYTMLRAFFLYETFKQDVCAPLIDLVCTATTLRRRVIEIAGKIVRHGGRVVLRVTAATFKALNFEVLWQKSGVPPKYCWSEETSNAEKITCRWGGVSEIAEI